MCLNFYTMQNSEILTGYIDRLNEAEKSWKNMWQVYVGVWDCYATEAFHNPEAYNLLIF